MYIFILILNFGKSNSVEIKILLQLDEMEELLSLRETRTPVRLRFGRRSAERVVPHIFPQEVNIFI